MAKYYGAIGYASSVETEPGIWEESITEREAVGDMLENIRSLENSGEVNDNISISNRISIVADPYAIQNFHTMRYATYLGIKWKVKSVNVNYPRLILSLGGVWNGYEKN